MARVSIIIPVFNAETYLSKCVDSVLDQSFSDWELILVDDGSRDRSGVICDEYEKKDARIIVFHKENGGVSSARNTGLAKAKGEWITFIDADDYIDKDYLSGIDGCSSDICIKSCLFLNNGEESVRQDLPLRDCNYTHKFGVRLFFSKYIALSKISTPWCKFFRRRVIDNVTFEEGINIGEDSIFVLNCLKNCNSVQVINKGKYYYNENLAGDVKKYSLTVYDAVRILDSFIDAYSKAPVLNFSYMHNTIKYFKSLCVDDYKEHSEIWKSSPKISKYSNSIFYAKICVFFEKVIYRTILRTV